MLFQKPAKPGTVSVTMAEDFSLLSVTRINEDKTITQYDITAGGDVTTTHTPDKKGCKAFTMESKAGSWRALDTLETVDRILTKEGMRVKRQLFTRCHLPHLNPEIS